MVLKRLIVQNAVKQSKSTRGFNPQRRILIKRTQGGACIGFYPDPDLEENILYNNLDCCVVDQKKNNGGLADLVGVILDHLEGGSFN